MRALVYGLLWVGTVCATGIPGWYNAASNGGGRALPNGLGAALGNPAAAVYDTKLSVEVGAGGIGENMFLWAAGVQPMGEDAVLGVGLVEPSPGTLNQHRLELSGVTRPFAGTWLGARGTLQKNPLDHRVELSLGVFHQISPSLAASWTINNLTESLDSNYLHHQGRRDFGLGLAWAFDRENRYVVWLDGETQRFALNKHWWKGVGGFKIEVGKQRNFQLLSGLSFAHNTQNWQSGLAAGVGFQQQFFDALLNCRYALSGIDFKQGGGAVQHAISVGVVFNAFADEVKPLPFVRAAHPLISPTGVDSLPQENVFYLRIDEDSGLLENWNLVIYTTTADLAPQNVVRRFSGAGMPPHAVRWHGDDVVGAPCPPGIYAYRLIASDGSGNQNWTEWQHLELR